MVANRITYLFCAGTRGFLKLAVSLLLISAVSILVNRYNPAFLNSITETINSHPIEYLLCRWGILCSFILCWPYIISKIGQFQKITSEQISHWRFDAWKLGLWLVIIELLIGENLIAKTIHLLQGL